MKAPHRVGSLKGTKGSTRSLRSDAGRSDPSRVKAVSCVQQSGLQARVDEGVFEDAEK